MPLRRRSRYHRADGEFIRNWVSRWDFPIEQISVTKQCGYSYNLALDQVLDEPDGEFVLTVTGVGY